MTLYVAKVVEREVGPSCHVAVNPVVALGKFLKREAIVDRGCEVSYHPPRHWIARLRDSKGGGFASRVRTLGTAGSKEALGSKN